VKRVRERGPDQRWILISPIASILALTTIVLPPRPTHHHPRPCRGPLHHSNTLSFYTAPHEMPVQSRRSSRPPLVKRNSSIIPNIPKSPPRRSEDPILRRRCDYPEVGRTESAGGAGPGRTGKDEAVHGLMGPNETNFRCATDKQTHCFRDRGCSFRAKRSFRTHRFPHLIFSVHSAHWMHLVSQDLPTVKGFYERNFVVFKAALAFETFIRGIQDRLTLSPKRGGSSGVSTNVVSMPLVRRAFMWAFIFHGSGPLAQWDGVHFSIRGLVLYLAGSRVKRSSVSAASASSIPGSSQSRRAQHPVAAAGGRIG